MGTWGAKLYQDDVAQDVRDQFKDLLRRGKTAEEITNNLVSEYAHSINDQDDGPVFWFALADTQWELGRLLPEVKKQAVAWLDKGGDLAKWQVENPKLAVVREKALDELRRKLNTPQPPEKKISQYRLYKCEWKIGDVFAYPLESNYAKEKCLFGRYVLFHKIGETSSWPGHIIPIVRVKITKDEKLPSCVTQFDKLEYIQTALTRFEDRFLPIDGRRPNEDIAEKSKKKYEVDEFGFLPQYKLKLLNTSKKSIPNNIFYVSNYLNVEPPTKEFTPHDEQYIYGCSWNIFDKMIIDAYCGYNLRQAKIYQTT
jgi:hypothetical protein